jgi:hypothetical protein
MNAPSFGGLAKLLLSNQRRTQPTDRFVVPK